MQTLTGLSEPEMRARLDEEFPADAYKRIPGAADLTDIDPAYMRHCLNAVFGLCGYGWGYTFDPAHVQMLAGGKGVDVAILAFTFWYKLVDDQGNVVTLTIPATGGSDNKTAAYALKGAVTNAIGHAASNLGFQESVYMGVRSHATTGKKKPVAKSAPRHPAKAVPDAGGNGQGMSLDQALAVVLPFGTKQFPELKGQTLAEVERTAPKLTEWLAHNAKAPTLRQAAGVIVTARAASAAD